MNRDADQISLNQANQFNRREINHAEERVLPKGRLIINADDWGQYPETTNRALECFLRGSISSVSAMVLMKDSERAAGIARERGMDAGLHLNLTAQFSAPGTARNLIEHQERVARYLRLHRYAQVIFHPGLARSFDYLVAAQRDEFCRLYGDEPARWDGHHHMHLCSNVLVGGLLPRGTIVRRSFSFLPGDKMLNQIYRGAVNRALSRRHSLTDYFFSLPPFYPAARIERIFSVAARSVVEVETHPVNPEEYQYLMGGDVFSKIGDAPIESGYTLPQK
jgi:YdjC-like protein